MFVIKIAWIGLFCIIFNGLTLLRLGYRYYFSK